MDFFSFSFIFRFLPLFFITYYLVPDNRRNIVLFIGSIVFYAFISLPCTLILIIIVELNYFLASKIRPGKKNVLVPAISLNILILIFFKIGPLIMPGISFVTFQMIAFLIDCYRKNIEDYSVFRTYAVMFPKLISGPITRYQDLRADLTGKKRIRENVESGIELFVLGLSYKVLLANRLAGLWNSIQTIGFASISSPLAWLGAIGFSLQLYFDFQGYSLMAIGLGKMLGFNFPDNFDSPYFSRSVSEFYRRWHMTLGRWFKDYIYIPLGGNRAGKARTILNLFIVWILTGLWHGMRLNFVLWAAFLFCFISIEKLFLRKFLEKSRIFSHIYVIFLMPVSWMFFAITKIEDIWVYFSRMFAPIVNSAGVMVYTLDFIKYGKMYGPFIAAAILFALPWPERLIRKNSGKILNVLLLLILFWLSIYEIAVNANNPFMYFNF